MGAARLTSVERPDLEAAEPASLDLLLPSGRLRAHRFGSARGRLAVGIPGISANSRSFDFLGERLGGARRQLVAVDLRGRGHSSITPPGTYGWRRHARDVLGAAAQLGRPPADVIGHSMGAFVAMEMAAMRPEAVRRVVLIDGLGLPDLLAVTAILRVVRRLAGPSRTADDYLERVRLTGAVDPWNEYWDRAFRYELISDGAGVRPRTDPVAVLEDMAYGSWRDPHALWSRLTMPVLLVRATRPLLGGGGHVVSAHDRDRLLRTVAGAETVDVDANHYGVMTHPATATAIRRFLA
ncbi:MAG TPA: alpha/beta fold hydrolase [Candidatus Dormibacteraeota bacterium]|nr:alpha/beta fold hydrolase [Candidatus Dormibacteraeota bacterium]